MLYHEKLFRQRQGFECNPVALAWASLAVTTASTAYTIDAQKKSATAQEQYQAAATASAVKGAHNQAEAVREGQAQQHEADARTLEQARQTNEGAKANAITALGEAGGSSATANALLNEYTMQFGQYTEALRRQGQFSDASADARVAAIGLGADNAILNINQPISRPNYAAAGLTFAGQALSTYKSYDPDAFKTQPKVKEVKG